MGLSALFGQKTDIMVDQILKMLPDFNLIHESRMYKILTNEGLAVALVPQ